MSYNYEHEDIHPEYFINKSEEVKTSVDILVLHEKILRDALLLTQRKGDIAKSSRPKNKS